MEGHCSHPRRAVRQHPGLATRALCPLRRESTGWVGMELSYWVLTGCRHFLILLN